MLMPVFGEKVGVQSIRDLDFYSPRLNTAFVEGAWVDDFRKLEKEVLSVERRNSRRLVQESAQRDASRFGIELPEQRHNFTDILRAILRATWRGRST